MLKNGTSDGRKEWFVVGGYKKLPNDIGRLETTAIKSMDRLSINRKFDLPDRFKREESQFMKNMMEIFFGLQYVFPYSFLDSVEEQYPQFDNTDIYIVMSSNRLEITNVEFRNGRVYIYYIDTVTNKKMIINNIIFFLFDINDEYVKCSIENSGTMFKLEFTDDGLNYININLSDLKESYDFSQPCLMNIYDLVTQSQRCQETTVKYEVLYIGQAKSMFNRLNKHETILKILREYNLKYREKEIMLNIMKVNSKLFNSEVISELNCGITFGNSKWQRYSDVGDKITDENIVNVAEAMLIYYFKPEYNQRYKAETPSLKQKTYSMLKEANIHRISLGLNLYFEETREKLILYTKFLETESRHPIIECNLDDLYNKKNNTVFSVKDDWTDEEYNLMMT